MGTGTGRLLFRWLGIGLMVGFGAGIVASLLPGGQPIVTFGVAAVLIGIVAAGIQYR